MDFRKVDLAQNYIDFSEGSTNRQIVENSIKKYAHEEYMANPYLANYITEEEYISNELDWVFGCYIKQKYGTLAERNDVLEFEEVLKNRLIELGLDTNNDNELTKGELNDFESEYEMDLSNLGITNIDNLKYLSQITSLNLSNNNITDISSLKECKNIRKLNLNNNNISNISSIKDFYEIKELHLANNNITDISAIGQVESLKRIFVYDVVFTGYYDVPGRVVTIDLSNNNITDISVIANLRLLVSANLSHNKIRNINCLKDYNFATQDIPEGEEEYIDDYECLYEFEGIDLSYNYIDTSLETNQEAITVFENKGVMLNLENQDTSTLAGDVNGDGNITLADYAKILAHVKETKLLTGDEKKVADVNNDGKVTLADYAKVLAHVKETSLLH